MDLSNPIVRDRPLDLEICCKAWPVRNSDRFPKTAFSLNWQEGTLRCPNEVTVPFEVGGDVHFPPEDREVFPKRDSCTAALARTCSICGGPTSFTTSTF